MTSKIYTPEGIELHPLSDYEPMRQAGRLAASVLDMITDHVQVGVTTEYLDQLCHDYITKNGAKNIGIKYYEWHKIGDPSFY